MPHMRTMRVEVDDKTLKGLSLGQKVTMTVKGSVRMLEDSRMVDEMYEPVSSKGSAKKKKKIPGEVVLEVNSVSVKGANVFSDMADDEEED